MPEFCSVVGEQSDCSEGFIEGDVEVGGGSVRRPWVQPELDLRCQIAGRSWELPQRREGWDLGEGPSPGVPSGCAPRFPVFSLSPQSPEGWAR